MGCLPVSLAPIRSPNLHQVTQYDSLREILASAPSWNRTHSPEDYVLFRPVLYWILGLEYYFFGYRFVLWQLLGLSAHIAVAQLLLGFLRRTVIGGTVLPLLLALLFGVSYLPAELVLRNHLITYTVFALLALCTTMGMSELLATDRDRTFCAVLSSSAIAAFTYELGVVMSGCLQPCVFCTPAAHDNRAHRSSQTDGYVDRWPFRPLRSDTSS